MGDDWIMPPEPGSAAYSQQVKPYSPPVEFPLVGRLTKHPIAVRAFKTFIQGATAVLMATGAGFFDAELWHAAATGGFAAVISLLNNWASAAEHR
jgi:hypothetical protein